MRITLDIDDTLLIQAKAFAAGQQASLTHLIEESLALRLRSAQIPATNQARGGLPVFAGKGGLRSAIRDASSQRALLDAIDASTPQSPVPGRR